MIRLIEKARKEGARLSEICALLEVSPRTFQRHGKKKAGGEDGRKCAQAKRAPANGLTCEEEDMILSTVNQPRFAALSPAQIVPILADEGVYLASESTLYRILRKRGLKCSPLSRQRIDSNKVMVGEWSFGENRS